MNDLHLQHPGAILKESLMPYQVKALSETSGLPMSQLSAVLHCEAPVTAELSKALGIMLGTSETLWIALQHAFDEQRNVA